MRVDAFLYAGEVEMLDVRMATLRGHFDAHVAIIANRTHQGDPTPYLDWGAQAHAAGVETVGVELDDFDDRGRGGAGRPDYQVRERAHRDRASWNVAARAGSDGFVYLSDVDEIPRPDLIDNAEGVAQGDVWVYCMRMHPWAKEWLYPGPWWGTTVARGATARALGLQGMRDARADARRCPVIVGFFGDHGYYEGGWHLSYWGTDADRAQKLRSFSHYEHSDKAERVGEIAVSGRDINGVELVRVDPAVLDWPVGV